jgi:hypothetical protein
LQSLARGKQLHGNIPNAHTELTALLRSYQPEISLEQLKTMLGFTKIKLLHKFLHGAHAVITAAGSAVDCSATIAAMNAATAGAAAAGGGGT